METTEKINVVEQLEVCVRNSESLIQLGQDFVAFITISIGIELLGSCHDPKAFGDFKQSKVRFKNGFKEFKNIWYKNNSEFLFRNLRGPLVHHNRPGDEVELTSLNLGKAKEENHLKKAENDKTYIVVDCLLYDFKEAVASFKNKLQKQNSFNTSKLVDIFQVINVNTKNDTTMASSGTTEHITFSCDILPENKTKIIGNKYLY